MKKIILAFSLFVVISLNAQTSAEVELEVKKMKQALIYGDQDVAVSKMYNIIAIQGPESTYKDSLAYLYFSNRKYFSCFLVTKEILDRNPDKIELLEMGAISLESVGAKEKAVEEYQKLLAKSNKSFHAYKLAGLQLETNKLDDAYAAIKKADQLQIDDSITISFRVNPTYTQEVNLKPSIAYLEGIIAEALKKDAEAKAAFERAISLFPDFVLAKSRLDALND